MPLTPQNPRLLLLTKRVFQDGKQAAEVGDAYSAMRAVLLLDLAVEQTLNLIRIDVPDPNPQKVPDEPTWSQLWQEASRLGSTSGIRGIPGRKELERLHRARNNVQHHAIGIDPSVAYQFIAPVDTLLRTVFAALYALEFSTYSLAEAVRNPELRRILQESAFALDPKQARSMRPEPRA